MNNQQHRKRQRQYPIGSISSGTMRPEDLIPTFVANLFHNAEISRTNGHYITIGDVSAKRRKEHVRFALETAKCANGECSHEHMEDVPDSSDNYFQSEASDNDLETLFDMLGEYAGPYFYFGAHPGDGADYGYWLSDDWDGDFVEVHARENAHEPFTKAELADESIKVVDLADVPSWFRGEVAVINDHGNVTLYVKTARTFREVWAIV